MGFFRKNKRGGANAKKRSKNATEEGPTILPEPVNELPGKVELLAQEGTNSTEPESTHHEADGIIKEENLSPQKVADIVELEVKEEEEDSVYEPADLAGVENPSFEIVESPKPIIPSPSKGTSDLQHSPKDETSILEKFKAKSPVRRGNTVAERAAWLQTSAFKDDHSKSPDSSSSPVSHENARAKKMFWEGKTFHKETSNAPDPPSVRHRTDVMAKKRWLETVAFTPSGGGNMSGSNEGNTPERRKHTIGLLPSSPSNSNDEEGQGRTAKDRIQAIASYDKQIGDMYLDKEDDPYEWAYEVWHNKGMLPWRSASFADGEVSIHSTFREDVLSPLKSRSWDSTASQDSSPQSPKKYLTASPRSSDGMKSVPEQEQVSFEEGEHSGDSAVSEDTMEMATCWSLSVPSTPEINASGSADTESPDMKSATKSQETAVTENQAALDSAQLADPQNISTEFGSHESPALPVGPEPGVIASDASVQSDDASEIASVGKEEIVESITFESGLAAASPPKKDTSDHSLDENDENVTSLHELQQKVLRETATDVTASSADEKAADTPDEADNSPSDVVLDEEDEEIKNLYELQQNILERFRQEVDEGFVESDEEYGNKEPERSPVKNHIRSPRMSDVARQTNNDDTDSTNSSGQLRKYSKQYFASENTNGSRDFSADGESGVHLEPSVVTHASSITAEDISIGDALLFVNSSFDGRTPDVSKDESALFDLADEEQFQSEMNASANDRGKVFSWQRDQKSTTRPTNKDHAPSQPSRQVSTQGSGLGTRPESVDKEQHTSPADHAPAQPSRKISEEGQDFLVPEPTGEVDMTMKDVVQGHADRVSDHAPSRPMRKISVEGQDLVVLKEGDVSSHKHDTAPITPVRVASMETISPQYTSESLKKLRAKKIATAIRGQYVMWLTKSRSTTFRKTHRAPTLSWFSSRPNKARVHTKEDNKAPILLPFLSIPPGLEEKFRPSAQCDVPTLMSPKRLSRVTEPHEGEQLQTEDERETSFDSSRQGSGASEAMERLELARERKISYMRRAFGTAQENGTIHTKTDIEQGEVTSADAAADLYQKLTAIPVPDPEDIQAIFEEVDRNGDGSLSLQEVEKAVIQRKEQFRLSPTIIMRAFQKTDANGNGSISRGEFFHFIRCINYFQNLLLIFEEIDKDGNRRLSREEFVQAAHILNVDSSHAEEVFEEMDENNGGYVVFDEFCLWMADKRALEDVAKQR